MSCASGVVSRIVIHDPGSWRHKGWSSPQGSEAGQRDALSEQRQLASFVRRQLHRDRAIRKRVAPCGLRRKRDGRCRRLQLELHVGVFAIAITETDPVVLIQSERCLAGADWRKYKDMSRRLVVQLSRGIGTREGKNRPSRREQGNPIERRGNNDFASACMVCARMKVIPTLGVARQVDSSLPLT